MRSISVSEQVVVSLFNGTISFPLLESFQPYADSKLLLLNNFPTGSEIKNRANLNIFSLLFNSAREALFPLWKSP